MSPAIDKKRKKRKFTGELLFPSFYFLFCFGEGLLLLLLMTFFSKPYMFHASFSHPKWLWNSKASSCSLRCKTAGSRGRTEACSQKTWLQGREQGDDSPGSCTWGLSPRPGALELEMGPRVCPPSEWAMLWKVGGP